MAGAGTFGIGTFTVLDSKLFNDLSVQLISYALSDGSLVYDLRFVLASEAASFGYPDEKSATKAFLEICNVMDKSLIHNVGPGLWR